ncbi:Uncharacterized protein RNJ44_02361 [Nakaseomyces bracarensis]|uniref:protein-serine/threonine phosphatase n=1 Tax=Nakaseomyces bracarensis TaxID=273131 RepID=A0ABR4NNC7_9SACH
MGQILSNPVIDKEIEFGNDDLTAFAVCAMQGWRMSMEDTHVTRLNLNDKDSDADHIALYCVFDGHGGASVANFCGERIENIVREQKTFQTGDLAQTITDAYLAADEELLGQSSMSDDRSGCTATSILISRQKGVIICGNSGDSRTVLSSAGTAKALSFDHKPTLPGETARINAANGFVQMDRVNGNLALSRAIGDFEYKSNPRLLPHEQIVTCVPDIIEHKINYEDDEFVVLACDGIWDCLSSQECIDIIHYGIHETNMSLEQIASRVVDVCCAPSTEGPGIGCDNMSLVIVALLKGSETLEQWFTRIRAKNYTGRDTFENKRREVFSFYDFSKDKGDSENDPSGVFAVTSPSKLHAEKKKSIETGVTAKDPVDNKRSTSSTGGVIDFTSLESLLEAGIKISQRPNGGAQHFQGSALVDMLASLSEAAAGETGPQEKIEDNEFTEDISKGQLKEISK